MIGLMHHQQLEPARAVLLVDLDAELAAGAAFPELALQLAAQAERRAGARLADEEDRALGIADLIDADPTKNQSKNQRELVNWACLPVVVYRELCKTPWWQETARWKEMNEKKPVRYVALRQEIPWFLRMAIKMIGVSNAEVRRPVQEFLEGMTEYLEIV